MNTFPWEYLGTMQSLLASPSHNYPSNLPRSDFNPLVVPGPEAREGTFFLQGLYPTGQLLLPVSLCSIGMERGRQEAEGHPSPELQSDTLSPCFLAFPAVLVRTVQTGRKGLDRCKMQLGRSDCLLGQALH